MLSKIVQKVHVASIWKTFSVLLEYCCKTDYESLLNDLERDLREEQNEQNSKYEEEIGTLSIKNLELMNNLDEIKDKMLQYEKDAYNERQAREKFEKDYNLIKENSESEVNLRMQFEDKLNSIHSVNRQLKEQISKIETEYEQNKVQLSRELIKCDCLSQEIADMTIFKTEATVKIESYEVKIKNLERELDVLSSNYTRNEDKLINLDKEFNGKIFIFSSHII